MLAPGCIDVDWSRGHALATHGEFVFTIDLVSGARSPIKPPILQTPAGPTYVRTDGAGIEFPPSNSAVAADGRIAYIKSFSELRLIDGDADRRLAWIPCEPIAIKLPQTNGSPAWSPDGRFLSASLTHLRRQSIDEEGKGWLDAHADEYTDVQRAALGLEPVEVYLIIIDLETGQVATRHRLSVTPIFAPCD